VSWIHLDDLVRLIELALDRATVRGPLNATAPHPVRHAQFQRQLAMQLRRPLWAHVPGWILRLGLGEMAELLISGQYVLPRRSVALGFQFRYPEIAGALATLFGHQTPLRSGGPAQVYFNGQCRVCNAEMAHYARIAKSESLPVCFIDSTRDPESFARYGLRGDHLERRVYLRDARGHISSGLDALLELWRGLPRYRWLARTLSLPGLRQIATAFYDLMLAPSLAWSARRRASSQTR
jgi:predicted DCC family thiol-disulfide oxidoreductase YuxK